MPTAPARMDNPLDALWQPALIIWVLLAGEGLAIVLALSPAVSGDRWVQLGLNSLIIQWISLLTLCALYLQRQGLRKFKPVAIAQIAILVMIACGWLVCGATWAIWRDLWPTGQGSLQSLLVRQTAISLTVGVFGLLAFHNHWRARQLAVRAKQLELEALQARIRPHFLFNTLNTAVALVHARPDEAERVLLDLTDLFRSALSGDQKATLSDELALTRRYLEIEALRFGDRVQIHWHLPDVLPDVPVPSLSIQPLAENAIRHGIEQRPGGGRIDISVDILDRMIEVVIANDMPASGRRSDGHAIGLKSARERVLAMTGGRGQVDSRVEAGRYLTIMSLPRN